MEILKNAFEDYSAINHIIDYHFSYDSSQIYYISNIEGPYNVWQSALEKIRKRPPQKVAGFEDSHIRAFGVSKKEMVILAERDRKSVLYLVDLGSRNGNRVRRISRTDGRCNIGPRPFSTDGRFIVYKFVDPDGKSSLNIYDLVTCKSTKILDNAQMLMPGFWSNDSNYLTISEFVSNLHQRLYLIDSQKGSFVSLTQGLKGVFMLGPWRFDDSSFFFFLIYKATIYRFSVLIYRIKSPSYWFVPSTISTIFLTVT